MGFWHTGYFEHHENTGLGEFSPDLSPPVFPCKECDSICQSADELRKHRFEIHPLRRPTLSLRGQELGADSVRVTRSLAEEDLDIDCDRAFINGKEILVSAVCQKLSHASSDTCRIKLCKGRVSEEFKLDFRIATKEGIQGNETQFEEMILGRKLDSRVVNDFINATKEFSSADGYSHGICQYLYGVMAKERHPDSSLPHKKYVGKYNEAGKSLADYERPLARAIGSVIGFHFNHFTETICLAGKSNIGRAALRYADWMRGGITEVRHDQQTNYDKIGRAIMDCDTEQIVRWAVCHQTESQECVAEIELFLKRDIEEYDKVKVQILLSEICSSLGDSQNSIQHAKPLRNLPDPVGAWVETKIRENSKDWQ